MWELARPWPRGRRKQSGQGQVPELTQDGRIKRMTWMGIRNESRNRYATLPNGLMNRGWGMGGGGRMCV